MNNLVSDGVGYERIFIKDDNTLIKYSMVEVDAWKSLQNKNIDFVNTPIKALSLNDSEKEKYPLYQSKIYLPFLDEYDTLYGSDIANNMDTKEALLLFKKNLLLLKEMHSKDVLHTDIFYKNIMINQNYDLKFIDLDASIIDDYISSENIYSEDDSSFSDKKGESMRDDKIDLLAVYFNYLVDGGFYLGQDRGINFSNCGFSSSLKNTLDAYLRGDENISKDYYYLDIVDDLLNSGYEAPKLLKKMK